MYCTKCGNKVMEGNFCDKCGAKINNYGPQQQQPPSDSYYPHQGIPQSHYAPGSFVEGLHGYGKSVLFLVGIILFSAGYLFSVFVNFSIYNVFTLMYLALPITGFWLIYAASYSPAIPEKTLPALTLFKVTIIIDLVLMCLLALVLFIASIILFITEIDSLIAAGFFLLLIAGGIVAYSVYYFKLSLQVLDGIRYGITNNNFYSIPNINVFTVLTYIGIGLTVLFSLVTAATSSGINYYLRYLIYYIPSEFRGLFTEFSSGSSISVFFTLVASTGEVICIIVLNQFKKYADAKRTSVSAAEFMQP